MALEGKKFIIPFCSPGSSCGNDQDNSAKVELCSSAFLDGLFHPGITNDSSNIAAL